MGALAFLVSLAVVVPLGQATAQFLIGAILKFRTGLPIGIEPAGVFAWMSLALAGSALASAYPAYRASRAPVHEALAYE